MFEEPLGDIEGMVIIQCRSLNEVNTDPQRRCYYGVHAKSEMIWGPWRDLCYSTPERLDYKLKSWRDLNAYAVSQRGEGGASEYRSSLDTRSTI